MAPMNDVRLDLAAIRRLGENAQVKADLLHVGNQVADAARQMAPKRTGAGAASIRAEVVDDEVHVSWDTQHFYLLFSELGTEHQPPRPFLRPAADRRY